MKIHVSELEGRALDLAVAMASGIDVRMSDGYPWQYDSEGSRLWNPTRRWSQCGPLIEKYDVWLCHEFRNDEKLYTASTHLNAVHTYDTEIYEGRTAQVAICRAVVAVQLGEEVEIPDELAG